MATYLRQSRRANVVIRSSSARFVLPVSLPLPPLPPPPLFPPPPQHRKFSQWTYDRFFSPSPPSDPTILNHAIHCSQWYFTALHDSVLPGGISWGWTVILGTFVLRTLVTFPLLVLNEVNQDRLKRLYEDFNKSGLRQKTIKEIEELAEHAPELIGGNNQRAKERLLNAERKRLLKILYEKRNCHPAKAFALPFVQIPLWLASSVALRNMSGGYVVEGAPISPTRPEMAGNAFSTWIPDLCLPDATGAVSVLLLISYVALFEINVYKQFAFTGERPTGRRARIVTNALRCGSLIVPVFALWVPATVSLYWLTSALVGLAHNVVVMSPRLRRRVGITFRASPYDTPARTIWAGFKGYWKL